MITPKATPVVVDTSVVSILWERDEPAAFYTRHLAGKRRVISFQTLEELRFGALRRGWGYHRQARLNRFLEGFSVVWPSFDVVDTSARLRTKRETMGRPLSTADAWIASTALFLNCPLATHNRDFKGIEGLLLIKAPASEQRPASPVQ